MKIYPNIHSLGEKTYSKPSQLVLDGFKPYYKAMEHSYEEENGSRSEIAFKYVVDTSLCEKLPRWRHFFSKKKQLETTFEQLCDCSNRSIVHQRKGLMFSNLHNFVDKSLLNLETKTYFFYRAPKNVENDWKTSRWTKKNRVIQ
jgi:hypothetical protein